MQLAPVFRGSGAVSPHTLRQLLLKQPRKQRVVFSPFATQFLVARYALSELLGGLLFPPVLFVHFINTFLQKLHKPLPCLAQPGLDSPCAA
jgi:hypothetical protein